jgi:hypothetical protein
VRGEVETIRDLYGAEPDRLEDVRIAAVHGPGDSIGGKPLNRTPTNNVQYLLGRE